MKRFILALLIFTICIVPTTQARTAWSKARTKLEVTKAAAAYHVPAKWITTAAINIVYIGAAESHGAYWARGGRYLGLFQFTPSWNQNATDRKRHRSHPYNVSDWRSCPQCSVYRFVRSYRDGGRSAIERHWAATLYR